MKTLHRFALAAPNNIALAFFAKRFEYHRQYIFTVTVRHLELAVSARHSAAHDGVMAVVQNNARCAAIIFHLQQLWFNLKHGSNRARIIRAGNDASIAINKKTIHVGSVTKSTFEHG